MKRVSAAASESTSSSDESLITPFVKRKHTVEYVKLTYFLWIEGGERWFGEDIHTYKWHEHPDWPTKRVIWHLQMQHLSSYTYGSSNCICCKYILGCQQCVDTWYQGELEQAALDVAVTEPMLKHVGWMAWICNYSTSRNQQWCRWWCQRISSLIEVSSSGLLFCYTLGTLLLFLSKLFHIDLPDSKN